MKDRQIFHPMNPSNLLLRVNNIHHRCRPTRRECQQASEQKGYAEEVFHCVTIFLIFLFFTAASSALPMGCNVRFFATI